RKQRAFAGAVEPEQDDEGCRWNRKAYVSQGRPRTVGVADPINRQGRRIGSIELRSGLLLDRDHHGSAMKTPQGCSPTWIVLTTFRLATSMTETSFDRPLVARRYFSSGVKANCQTRWPTSRYFWTLCDVASTTAMRLAGPSAMKAVLPSLVILIPTGWI